MISCDEFLNNNICEPNVQILTIQLLYDTITSNESEIYLYRRFPVSCRFSFSVVDTSAESLEE